VALLLWQVAWEVVAWARADERAGLFAPTAHWTRLNLLWNLHVPGVVAPLLRALSEAVLMEPEAADPGFVALLCREVSEWAKEVGATETALWYAQAAELALMRADAPAAFSTGWISHRLGEAPSHGVVTARPSGSCPDLASGTAASRNSWGSSERY